MGEVYRAHDAVLDREVALKVLHSDLAGDPGFIERFRREARAAAMLGHSNIVAVHDWGATQGGTYFMVMEFVRGHSLRQVLAKVGRLSPAQAADVGDPGPRRPSTTRTPAASSTATSSPRTSWSPSTAW